MFCFEKSINPVQMEIYIQFLISFTNKSDVIKYKLYCLIYFKNMFVYKKLEKYSSDNNFKCIDELILKHFLKSCDE